MATKPTPAALGPDAAAEDSMPVPTPQEVADQEYRTAVAAQKAAQALAPQTYEPVSSAELEQLGQEAYESASGGMTLADELMSKHPEVIKALVDRQLAAMGAVDQHLAEVPERLKAAREEDLIRNAAMSGIPIGTQRNINDLRMALAQQKQHLIVLFPDHEDPEAPRTFSISGLEFCLKTSVALRVPRDIVEFCVQRGWCHPPRDLAVEFELRNIKPDNKIGSPIPFTRLDPDDELSRGVKLPGGGYQPLSLVTGVR